MKKGDRCAAYLRHEHGKGRSEGGAGPGKQPLIHKQHTSSPPGPAGQLCEHLRDMVTVQWAIILTSRLMGEGKPCSTANVYVCMKEACWNEIEENGARNL